MIPTACCSPSIPSFLTPYVTYPAPLHNLPFESLCICCLSSCTPSGIALRTNIPRSLSQCIQHFSTCFLGGLPPGAWLSLLLL